jgi:tetratricopeptide (TPR) repeat protein
MDGYFKDTNMKLGLIKFIIALSLVCSFNLFANAYTPKDNDVIAVTKSNITASLSLNEIKTVVEQSQFVGQTENMQGVLKNKLSKLYISEPTPDIGYLYARVLQKEHLFNDAITVANNVLKIMPDHSNTHLLLANLYMTQGQFELAKQHCLALITRVSTLTASTCVLDVQSQHGNLLGSYQSLVKLANNKPIDLNTKHVLAEMSFRLQNYTNALKHLENISLLNAPVSLIVLWADIQLGLNKPQQVINKLSNLIKEPHDLEDALLLRLAIAEKQLNTTQYTWQNTMKQRVELREVRHDSFHASDLANYYIHVQPNKSKALYWANINWQQAKMNIDQALIIQAKRM